MKMAAQALHTRLDKLEAALKALEEGPLIYRWLDIERGDDPEAIIDEMVMRGEISELQRQRVRFIRWMTQSEFDAMQKERETWPELHRRKPEEPGSGD